MLANARIRPRRACDRARVALYFGEPTKPALLTTNGPIPTCSKTSNARVMPCSVGTIWTWESMMGSFSGQTRQDCADELAEELGAESACRLGVGFRWQENKKAKIKQVLRTIIPAKAVRRQRSTFVAFARCSRTTISCPSSCLALHRHESIGPTMQALRRTRKTIVARAPTASPALWPTSMASENLNLHTRR